MSDETPDTDVPEASQPKYRAVLCTPQIGLDVDGVDGVPPREITINRGDPRIIGSKVATRFIPVLLVNDARLVIYVDVAAFLSPEELARPSALTPRGVIAFPAPSNGRTGK